MAKFLKTPAILAGGSWRLRWIDVGQITVVDWRIIIWEFESWKHVLNLRDDPFVDELTGDAYREAVQGERGDGIPVGVLGVRPVMKNRVGDGRQDEVDEFQITVRPLAALPIDPEDGQPYEHQHPVRGCL